MGYFLSAGDENAEIGDADINNIIALEPKNPDSIEEVAASSKFYYPIPGDSANSVFTITDEDKKVLNADSPVSNEYRYYTSNETSGIAIASGVIRSVDEDSGSVEVSHNIDGVLTNITYSNLENISLTPNYEIIEGTILGSTKQEEDGEEFFLSVRGKKSGNSINVMTMIESKSPSMLKNPIKPHPSISIPYETDLSPEAAQYAQDCGLEGVSPVETGPGGEPGKYSSGNKNWCAAQGCSNGSIPEHLMTKLSWNKRHKLNSDAAKAFEGLNKLYKQNFCKNISMTDSYRPYSVQVRLKAQKPTLAAKPGTSNHGWGLAVDLGGGINNWNTAEHRWMKQYASVCGWENPGWAQKGRGKEEPWHWEFNLTVTASCPGFGGDSSSSTALATGDS